MTFNEAAIEARKLVERTNRLCYIFSDNGVYIVSTKDSYPDLTLAAVVHPVFEVQ